MRGRLTVGCAVVAAAALVAAGCGDTDEDPVENVGATTGPETAAPETSTTATSTPDTSTPDTSTPTTETAEPTESPTEPAEPTEADSPDETDAGILSIDSSCIEPDGIFTVRGLDLDPGSTYWVSYEPNPAPGQIEDVAPFFVDDDGVGEVSAVIPHGADPELGRYAILLFQEGNDEPLDTFEFELAESC
jgi:hypothetical protein